MINTPIQFKDVAHFYLGVKCQTPEGIDTLKAVYADDPPVFYHTVKEYSLEEVKPILRPLTDNALMSATFRYHQKNMTVLVFADLIKDAYDIFNLIESGQAIEDK